MLHALLPIVTETAVNAAAVAQETTSNSNLIPLAAIGAGLAVIGGGYGISKAAASGNEAIARQPEAASDIRGNSLILSALIEGATFFGVLVALLLALKQV
ncbi:MAG: F0F1 ATP synthase subunit C [Planctomycetota bacterium]|nr:MAG: F0F1 ATP synthase subunit C [Planctomycetota bacterium]